MSKVTETPQQPLESNSDKLGTMPVGKLLFSMAGPMIVAMIIQALYNIVDSIYVSRISEDALTAVSLAYPLQNAKNFIFHKIASFDFLTLDL